MVTPDSEAEESAEVEQICYINIIYKPQECCPNFLKLKLPMNDKTNRMTVSLLCLFANLPYE